MERYLSRYTLKILKQQKCRSSRKFYCHNKKLINIPLKVRSYKSLYKHDKIKTICILLNKCPYETLNVKNLT
jgi:hypothetical protein